MWLGLIVAFAITATLLAALRGVAGRIGLVDDPSERKVHAGRVPLVGGLAMFCGFALGALTLEFGLAPYRAFFAAAGVLVVVGVLDDLHELSSRARFGAQIVAAALMVYGGDVMLSDLGGLRPDGTGFILAGWEILFTVFATVGVINALNMSDGVDGLAGGYALIALAGLAWVAHDAGRAADLAVLALLCGVVVAFLAFNARLPGRPRALVFMGDAGSMFLGFAITWFCISLSQGDDRAMPPVTALWLLMLPLFDTVWLLVRRPLTGRWPTSADFEHLHHVLQMTGLGVRRTVALLWVLAALAAAVGLAARGVPEREMFWIFLGLFAAYCATLGIAWQRQRLLLWPMERRIAGRERRGRGERRAGDRRGGGDRRAGTDRRDGTDDP